MDSDIQDKGRNTEASFANLYEGSLKSGIKELGAGSVFKGKVVHISPDIVLIDIGYKSEGCIPAKEFLDENGNINIKVGDEVEVFLETTEDKNGHLVLSKAKLDRVKTWELIKESLKTGKVLNGKVLNRVKGGFHVNIGGITAFLPGSQVDTAPVKDYDRFVGMTLDLKVLNIDEAKQNVIVSHRAVLASLKEEARAKMFKTLEEGMVVEGIVKGIADYGAFIDLGGIDGLLHISDISWRRITHPSQKLSVGDKVNVKVLKFNREEAKVSLGLKQLRTEPWSTAKERYPVGSRVKGKVANILDYGTFIELEDGIEGLLHISEISWKKIKHPSEKLKVGDTVEVKIIDVDAQNKRISLSLKQLEPNLWDDLEARYPKGSRIKGTVKNILDFGIFVNLEDGIDGLIYISDISWGKIKHPSELFQIGQEIEAVVLNIDKNNERFSLGIKQLENDPWNEIDKRYSPGMTFKGRITSIADFGAFVEIERGVEGLVHISELKRSRKKGIEVNVGDDIEAEILNIDPEEKKIGLSIRQVINPRTLQDIIGEQGN